MEVCSGNLNHVNLKQVFQKRKKQSIYIRVCFFVVSEIQNTNDLFLVYIILKSKNHYSPPKIVHFVIKKKNKHYKLKSFLRTLLSKTKS